VTDRPSSVNADGIFEPFPTTHVPWEVFSKGDRFGIRYRQIGDYGGGTHIGVGIEEIEPGRQACPAHYHMLEEEHLMILDGALTLRLGKKEYEMTAGDFVCFPAGQRAEHALLNRGDKVCRYLIIGERNDNEVIIYPDAGRVGVRLMGHGYRANETMDYWDDVDL
jgi:uncharacterized cupin superfamily protein